MKRLKTEPEKELTKAELEVMQILWKLKKAFVGDILDRMVEPKPAYNTVSTVVRLLEKKGVVGHESFGKSHRYYPLVDKETYADSYVRRVMGNFFDGSLESGFVFYRAGGFVAGRVRAGDPARRGGDQEKERRREIVSGDVSYFL